jgi:peroxiredoxin Q/BCP
MAIKSAKTSKTKARTTAKSARSTKRSALDIGSKAPNVSLPALKGTFKLNEAKGQKVVLYFYPKDDTSGCTKEACTFQENLAAFKKAGVTVIGISKDNLVSHEKFAKKYKLNFNLASDEDTKVAGAFGSWVEKSMYGRKYMGMDRSTFLIDGKGVVQGVWRKVKVPGHVEEVLAAAKKLK